MSEAEQRDASLYLVGGPVRDLMLHRRSWDLDLVTEGDVEALATGVAEAVGSKAALHRRFGTATVKFEGARLDLATARRETYARPGALPTVMSGTIEEDLGRRDFTINAMALGLSGRHNGQLLDPSGGLDDLTKGVVRVLHQRSFVDDATRIFRAVRYEQRLGFRLESETRRRLLDALDDGMLATVSADRLRHEIELILAEDVPVRTLLRAGELGVLHSLYTPLKEAEWIRAFDEEAESLTLVAALAYMMSTEGAQAFVARLNMPSAWAGAVMGMTRLASDVPKLKTSDLPPSMLYRTLEGRPMASIDALARLTPKAVLRERLIDYSENLRFVQPILRGGDLIALGATQGPVVGEILRRIRDARLDGEARTVEEERALALRYLADLRA